jgi:indole-3-glycerol phosphate synthase
MNRLPSSPTYLDRIVADVRKRLDERKLRVPLSVLQGRVQADRGGDHRPSFAQALRRPQVSLIAEVKRRSPSKGALRPDLDVSRLVETYAAAGAAAVSVLTEEDHFGGSLADLKAAVSRVTLPVLRKDFIVDPYQVWETRAYGASAVLLIASLLSDQELWQLAEVAGELGLDVLLEVHDAAEVERAVALPGAVIGINNRDLRSFQVSLETTVRLARKVPGDRLLVAESGIGGRADVERVAQAGVDAVLVGEALLRETDPEQAARSLLVPPVPVVGRGVTATTGEEDS